jgi:4-diphosphocytidyl-2-C-methyl-D-erythritol kinase
VTGEAPAKINLALVVGPTRPDGRHEVVTVLEHIDLVDTVSVEPARELRVEGFAGDTIVERALEELGSAAAMPPSFVATIEKRIPVAAGLAGGSSDAAIALRLANALLGNPLPECGLDALAAQLGADVPFFLRRGAQLGTGDGSTLAPLELPTEYHVVVWLPHGAVKESTAAVYRSFDRSARAAGFAARREDLFAALAEVRSAKDLRRLPANDLASSPRARELRALGAFRADVSGAGPALYGLFADPDVAAEAARRLADSGRTWLARPCWYG